MRTIYMFLFCIKLASIAGLSKDPNQNTDSDVQSAENYPHTKVKGILPL